MIRALCLGVLLLGAAGCRCKSPGPVNPVDLGLRVDPTSLDFGRVLEGDTKTLPLTLTSITRAPVSVTLTTDAPFAVDAEAEVPGGGDVTVMVRFLAGNVPVTGALQLQVADQVAEVPLSGVGVRPPVCVPSAQCIESVYSLEQDRCIETQSADDTPCEVSSVCLEQGRCRSGQCLGVARSCDDGDPCTDDACAIDAGCIKVPHQCPAPTEPCRVAICDSQTGCGSAPAPDFTLCGAADCIEVHYCLSGECRTDPTPEGFVCGPPIACLPEATCHNQDCERVHEGDWAPEWTAPLGREPVGELASIGGTLFLSVCEAGSLDAGADAGAGDAGRPEEDAGSSDAGVDAGVPDAGAPDAGEAPDGGDADASVPFLCGMTSYTSTGFERTTVAYADGAPRWLWATGSSVVLARAAHGLELRSSTTLEVDRLLPFEGGRPQVALSASGEIFLVAGNTLQVWAPTDAGLDAGPEALGWVGDAGSIARGEVLFAWDDAAQTLTRVRRLADGGTETSLLTAPVAASSLAVRGDDAVLGADGLLRADGGFLPFVIAVDGGVIPAASVLAERTLVDATAADVFFTVCDGGCEERVAAISVFTGLPMWDAQVHPADPPSRTVLTSQLGAQPGAVLALVRSETDAGALSYFELLADGSRQGLCRLPGVSGRVEQATVTAGALVVTTRRADGGVQLESYPLNGLPSARSGWPTANGVLGRRSDR